MRLHRLEIHNYKSLRNVAIEPTPLSVFVGPNASGKTNLADAIDFLGLVYAWSLEKAVSSKGGYDGICFRDKRRSVDPIRFSAAVEFLVPFPDSQGEVSSRPEIQGHSFEFKASSQGIQAPYVIGSERFVRFHRYPPNKTLLEFLRIARKGKSFEYKYNVQTDTAPEQRKIRRFERYLKKELIRAFQGKNSKSELFLSSLKEGDKYRQEVGNLRVFQVDPRSCREAGIPSPAPYLDRSGRNLPIALDHLKKTFPAAYAAVLETARKIMPTLEAIETDWTHNRALTLFLREKGVKRPWTSEDISTGTIQTIALLVAVFDPRSPLVVIEEPENSVHPWALRNLVEAFRAASENKQIMLTTHSPILIDQLKPEEVWVVRKPGTETKIDPLLSLDSSLEESWGQGKFTLSEYLDSGAVPEAVPAAGS